MLSLDVSRNLFFHYEQTRKVDNYFGLLAIWALAQTAVESKNENMLHYCQRILDQYPDNFEHPHYNFESYRCGGNGKAWLAMNGKYDGQAALLREYAEKTLAAPKDRDGILCMPRCPEKEQVWIDVAMCVTPFMLYTGLLCGEERYITFAAEQTLKMVELFRDPSCGLLHQSRGFMENVRDFSQDHWSRGNGWGMVGLTELVKYLPQDSKFRAPAEKAFVDLCRNLLRYQTSKGVWRQEITEPLAWEESSGTGLILYGIGTGLRLGLLPEQEFRSAYEAGISGMCRYFIRKDFTTERSCPGCLCPGSGAEKGSIQAYITEKIPYPDEPHSFGCLMLALVEAERNGIHEVEIGTAY